MSSTVMQMSAEKAMRGALCSPYTAVRAHTRVRPYMLSFSHCTTSTPAEVPHAVYQWPGGFDAVRRSATA